MLNGIYDNFYVIFYYFSYSIYYFYSAEQAQIRGYNFGNEIQAIPKIFHVSSNFPNPFNPTTQVLIDIPEPSQLVVNVYDITGHLIYDVKEPYLSIGRFRFEWSGRNRVGELVPTGIYFISVETGSHYHVQKIALVK